MKRLLLFIVFSAAAQDFDHVVQKYVADRSFMGSVLVARGNQVLFSKGYGFANLEWRVLNDAATKFRIASITKQFTSASILLLEERGKLTLDDPVKKFLPDAPAAWDKITLRNLLTHTSGIPDALDTPEFAGILSLMTNPEELVGRFRALPLDFAPGSQFSYSNSGYILLSDLIEKISGASYADFLRENIFAPLEMNDSGYDSNSAVIPHRASGYVSRAGGFENAAFIHMSIPQGAGGLYSTTGDLLKWNQALFGGKVLKPGSLQKMTTPFRENYAMRLSVEAAGGRKTIRHEGAINGFDTSLAYFPTDQLTIAVLSNVEVEGVHVEDLTNELGALVHGDKRASGAVFSGALVRVGKGSLTLRLADGVRVDAAISPSGELAATDIAARFRLADQARIECSRTKPGYDSEAALHLYLTLKKIELVRAATSREQVQEVAVPSWDSKSNLLSIPASLKSVSAAARDSAMAELERVRKVSLDRFGNRPNFVAEEITRRYRSEGAGEEWKLVDTIESVIAVKDDGISRENIRRNGKPFKQPWEKLGPMQGQSFGGELVIFDPGCSTKFDFEGLQAIAGRELRAYGFSLPPDNCLYTHTVSRHGGRNIGKYIPAVAGQVLVDRARAEVLRYECAAGGFPETFGIDRSMETESWDYVTIGGSAYLVPVAVTWSIHLANGSGWLFKVEYRNHRHFEASANITYSPGK